MEAARSSVDTPLVAPDSDSAPAVRDHGFHDLPVKGVVTETAEASSIVLDVPEDLRAAFGYEAGQFCTFRVVVDGSTLLRCYSMSSTEALGEDLQVTVKRVPGGAVSNWLLDNVSAGDHVEVTLPAGVFVLAPEETELVAFAGGSGITPVFSLLKTALATTDRRVRLLYANRDADSVIFKAELDRWLADYPDRFEVAHRFDVEDGFVDADAVREFLGGEPAGDAGYYLCGPAPFMDIVEEALLDSGVGAERIHLERFTPADDLVDSGDDDEVDGTTVTIELDGRREVVDHHPGTTILQTARQAGLSPPFSCESGSCATCMGRLLEGTVEMHVNNALTEDEVEEGWILTCQSVPTAPEVSVVYGY